jgi:hypothetical protein
MFKEMLHFPSPKKKEKLQKLFNEISACPKNNIIFAKPAIQLGCQAYYVQLTTELPSSWV